MRVTVVCVYVGRYVLVGMSTILYSSTLERFAVGCFLGLMVAYDGR